MDGSQRIRIETLNVSLLKNYTNNFIYVFLKMFFMISLCRKKTGNFQICFFLVFFYGWIYVFFFNDEIYDLVSLGFEEKSRKTQKNNHTKIKNHKNIIKKIIKKT